MNWNDVSMKTASLDFSGMVNLNILKGSGLPGAGA
jgi:hypothetical protein